MIHQPHVFFILFEKEIFLTVHYENSVFKDVFVHYQISIVHASLIPRAIERGGRAGYFCRGPRLKGGPND
jgi:hypothetical protein